MISSKCSAEIISCSKNDSIFELVYALYFQNIAGMTYYSRVFRQAIPHLSFITRIIHFGPFSQIPLSAHYLLHLAYEYRIITWLGRRMATGLDGTLQLYLPVCILYLLISLFSFSRCHLEIKSHI